MIVTVIAECDECPPENVTSVRLSPSPGHPSRMALARARRRARRGAWSPRRSEFVPTVSTRRRARRS